MSDIIGNGKKGLRCAQLIVTGISNNIPLAFTLINQITFPNLTFTKQLNNLITFDENTGIFVLQHQGVLCMSAILNVQASIAFSILELIPEFNQGSGWETGPGRKAQCSDEPNQIQFWGMRELKKDTQIRFYFASKGPGQIIFKTETLDPGGPHECILPAAIFYLWFHRSYEPII